MSYKVKRKCRVCGKEFTPCATCENDNVAFHWRTVACSYECGKEYFRQAMLDIERASNTNEKQTKTTKQETKTTNNK